MKHLIKSEDDLKYLRESGRRLGTIRNRLAAEAQPGVSTVDLDALGEELIRKGGDLPAFKDYKPTGAPSGFPNAVCISVNHELVHGAPAANPQTLKEGDIISIDIGLSHKGLITDTAMTVPVGDIPEETKTLLKVTKDSLWKGIGAATAGNRVGDIGYAVESFVGGRYGIVDVLGGHGVGWDVHEDPHILNVGTPGTGMELLAGMVVAIEPMLNMGTKDVDIAPDGYTFVTKDGKLCAHFEHTIIITDGEAEVVTDVD